jgi:hypothetical protein
VRAWLKSLIDRLPWIEDMRMYERLRQELDTSQLDEALEAVAGKEAPAAPEPYPEVRPFDADSWAAGSPSNRPRDGTG